jgi:UDP-N-acetylmuramyl pentapeptide phosphotransferase/UDP-N-acetylglucosamine-1-phosphate transferase
VRYLPLAIALLTAAALAPALRRSLAEGGHVRENYRGAMLPCPFGLLIVAGAFVALIPITLLARYADDVPLIPAYAVALVAGIAVLGLADDAFTGASRGWRGHGAAVLRGGFSTGALKAVGTVGLALYYSALIHDDDTRFLLAALVIVLSTNFFNLLDLRPGRSVKAFVLLTAALAIGSASLEPLKGLGLFVGPILVAGLYDVRERAMLGDTGSNVIGAVAGVWMVATLSDAKLAIAAGLLLAVTAYGEFRSISAFVERTPGFRHLDSIGRI